MTPEEFHKKIRRWAADNALTLIFLSAMFIITWGTIVLVELLSI